MPGLPVFPGCGLAALTVALSGRVLAFDWDRGGLLWRAERQARTRWCHQRARLARDGGITLVS